MSISIPDDNRMSRLKIIVCFVEDAGVGRIRIETGFRRGGIALASVDSPTPVAQASACALFFRAPLRPKVPSTLRVAEEVSNYTTSN